MNWSRFSAVQFCHLRSMNLKPWRKQAKRNWEISLNLDVNTLVWKMEHCILLSYVGMLQTSLRNSDSESSTLLCLPAASKLCAILQGSQHGQVATVWSVDDIKDKGVIVRVVRWLSMVIQLRFLQTWGTQSKTHQRRQGLIFFLFWFVCKPPTQGDCRSTARLAISTRQCTVGWSSVMAVFTPFQRSANECNTLCKGKTMKNKAWTLSMSWNAELQALPARRPNCNLRRAQAFGSTMKGSRQER